MILHIAQQDDWEVALESGFYEGPTLASEGFIHASTTAQVVAVANRIFLGRRDLVLLVIDEHRLSAEVRPENLEGGSELYPHIYGPMECEAVESVLPFAPESDGRFQLPAVLASVE
jgi:uncharacterized protein (DUF952 family)